MFSTKVTDGANSVADAVDLIADSNAPKNSTCIRKGMWSFTSVGRIIWLSAFTPVLSSASTVPGMMIIALVTRNIGTNANRM